MSRVHVVDHPLIQHKLSILRQKDTPTKEFRELVQELAMLMAYEITRHLPLVEVTIETPLAPAKAHMIHGKTLAIVPVLRAGLGMLDGILQLIPNAKVGHVGLYRDPTTLQPVEYYCKLPLHLEERDVIVVDPMLATGGSASAALTALTDRGAHSLRLMSIVSAPEGVSRVQQDHPDVDIWTAAIDEKLDSHGYIVPGLGDAGDRLYGTR